MLIGRMRSARDGTDEYKAAKLALEKRFDPYIQKLRDEGVAVNDLSALYDGLAKKITEANKQRFLEQAQSSIAQAYGDALNNIEADTKRIIGKIANELGRTLTGNEEGAIRHYVSTGEKNETFKSLGDVLQKHEIIAVAAEGVYGAVQRSEQSFADDLRDLMNRNTDAADKYSDAMVDAAKRFDAAEDRIAGGADASQQTYKISSIIAGIKKLDAEIEKLRQKAKTAGITEEEKGLLEGLVEDRETQAKLYKSLMGVDYDKQIKAAQTADDKATRDRISGIKAEISVLEKYSAAREKLEPWFGSDTDKELTKIFGDGKDYSTLDAQILSLCDSLRELGDAGVEAADQIEARLGLDKTSLIAKKQQQLKKYEASLQPYLGKDFSFSGSGIEYKASRILADYNTKVEQATQEYEKLYIEARRLDEETRTLGEQFSAELAQLEAERDEKFVALAESIYGEQTKGLNLSEWAHKSGGEIRGIIAALKGISVPQELAKILDENALKALADALNALANADIEKATNAFDNNKLRNWQKWAGAVSEIGSALKEYGDAAGNDTIAGIGEALSFVSETASDVFSRLAQGDILGASLSFIENIAKEIFAAATAAEEFKKALREANEEARYDAMIGMLGEDSIFGENGMRKVRDAVSVMQEARASMNGRDISRALKFKGGIGVLGLLKQAPQTLARLAESIGRDLYDAYGNLNADTLQAILDTYDDLKQTEKEWITQAIDDSKAYSEAMEQLDGVMQDIFGQITSSAADAIVDKWADAGDAALDYVDILDDVARAYAKMITQSMLLDSVFDDNFKQDLLKRFSAGDTEGAMELILQGMERMQELAPAIAEALEPLRPYIKTSSSSTDTLKDGINKELVEGNSSLIASYINAMRADLSVMRGMQTTGWSDVRFIREHLPTLADHLSDIAGNTFDNATAAQGILAKLTGIITTSTNGGNAVRTTK